MVYKYDLGTECWTASIKAVVTFPSGLWGWIKQEEANGSVFLADFLSVLTSELPKVML